MTNNPTLVPADQALLQISNAWHATNEGRNRVDLLATAQVYATLELARQQNIANMLSLLEHADADSYENIKNLVLRRIHAFDPDTED